MPASRRPGPDGVTHGALLGSLEVGGVRLTETAHGPGTVLGKHAHPHPALTFVVAGGFTEAFGRTALHCDRLSILLKPAGADHTNRYGNAGARSFIIEQLPVAASRGALSLAGSTPALAPATLVPCVLRLYGAFRAAHRDARPEALLPDVEELLLRAGPGSDSSSRGDTTRPPPWLSRAIERLNTSCEEPHSLRRMAHDAGVHPVHFARVFRRWTGASVGQYIRRRRVERAVAALGSGCRETSALAHRLGFSDQSHFTRAFRSATGATPAAFRTKASIVLA